MYVYVSVQPLYILLLHIHLCSVCQCIECDVGLSAPGNTQGCGEDHHNGGHQKIREKQHCKSITAIIYIIIISQLRKIYIHSARYTSKGPGIT